MGRWTLPRQAKNSSLVARLLRSVGDNGILVHGPLGHLLWAKWVFLLGQVAPLWFGSVGRREVLRGAAATRPVQGQAEFDSTHGSMSTVGDFQLPDDLVYVLLDGSRTN